MMRSGHRRRAITLGMALRTPKRRASELALATPPRAPPPPTATGLPRSVGSSRISTDAKNASRSMCRIGASSTEGFSEGEGNTAKRLTEFCADRPPGLFGAAVDQFTDGVGVAGQLRTVRQDRLHLGVDGARDIGDDVRFVSAAQKETRDLMGLAAIGEVQRHRGGWRDGVEGDRK